MNTKSYLLLGFMVLGIVVGAPVFAQETSVQQPAVKASVPYKLEKGPVTLYGITLDPYTEFYQSDENTGPRWDDVRYLVPEVLPDAQKGTLTSIQFCDFIYDLSKKYAGKDELNVAKIAYALRPHFPEISDEPSLIDQASLRLHSRDEKDLAFLLEKLPEMQTQIMLSKEWTMKTKSLIMLFDAAIQKTCPDHAKASGYQMYSASYYLNE